MWLFSPGIHLWRSGPDAVRCAKVQLIFSLAKFYGPLPGRYMQAVSTMSARDIQSRNLGHKAVQERGPRFTPLFEKKKYLMGVRSS